MCQRSGVSEEWRQREMERGARRVKVSYRRENEISQGRYVEWKGRRREVFGERSREARRVIHERVAHQCRRAELSGPGKVFD